MSYFEIIEVFFFTVLLSVIRNSFDVLVVTHLARSSLEMFYEKFKIFGVIICRVIETRNEIVSDFSS